MSTEEMRWYPSKIDWWLVPILFLPPLSALLVCVMFAIKGSWGELVVGVATAAFVAALYIGLVIPVRYGIDGSQLVVRFGLCRQRIPLVEITEVRPTRNPLSSPALSLDRLHIQFGPSFFKAVMISPANRDGFLDDLARAAGLNREGNRLVRR